MRFEAITLQPVKECMLCDNLVHGKHDDFCPDCSAWMNVALVERKTPQLHAA